MGLAERRAVKEFQEKSLPELTKEIQKLAGFEVPVEINWDQLSVDGQASAYQEYWTEVFFKPVIEALGKIGVDDMGKEALKSGVKKIEFRNSAGNYSPSSAITFEGGTITIDHDYSNLGDIKDRTDHLVTILEKGL